MPLCWPACAMIGVLSVSPSRDSDLAATAALMQLRTGSPPDPAVATRIHDDTGGNPFFVEEVCTDLSARGVAREIDGVWTATDPLDTIGIPEIVRDLLARRLSALSDGANTVLGVAAIAGRQFSIDVLEQAVSAWPVLDVLEEATAAGLLRDDPEQAGRYEFAHALVREALIDELGTLRRVRLHRQIGEALEALSTCKSGAPGRGARLPFRTGRGRRRCDQGVALARRLHAPRRKELCLRSSTRGIRARAFPVGRSR